MVIVFIKEGLNAYYIIMHKTIELINALRICSILFQHAIFQAVQTAKVTFHR